MHTAFVNPPPFIIGYLLIGFFETTALSSARLFSDDYRGSRFSRTPATSSPSHGGCVVSRTERFQVGKTVPEKSYIKELQIRINVKVCNSFLIYLLHEILFMTIENECLIKKSNMKTKNKFYL